MKKILLMIILLILTCGTSSVGFFNPASDLIMYDINNITTKISPLVLKIEATITTELGDMTLSGSSFVVKEDENSTYLLTNNHIINPILNLDSQTYTLGVIDIHGDYHEATIAFNMPDYDLAVLKINKIADLELIPFTEKEIPYNSWLFTISCQNQRYNQIIVGRYCGYYTILPNQGQISNGNNVTFPYLIHDAPIEAGSSGSIIVNKKMEIVGINVLDFNHPKKGRSAGAIGYKKILEFINLWEDNSDEF